MMKEVHLVDGMSISGWPSSDGNLWPLHRLGFAFPRPRRVSHEYRCMYVPFLCATIRSSITWFLARAGGGRKSILRTIPSIFRNRSCEDQHQVKDRKVESHLNKWGEGCWMRGIRRLYLPRNVMRFFQAKDRAEAK